MVHHQRSYHHLKKGEVLISGFVDLDETGAARGTTLHTFKRSKPRLLFLLFLSFISFTLIWTCCHHFTFLSGTENQELGSKTQLCSSVSNGTICCDRSSHRTDICFMKGNIRTNSGSSSILLYTSKNPENSPDQGQNQQIEKVRPYTRKWETSVMNTIEELKLVSTNSGNPRKCDVYHDVPAVFFSTGGYTGNVYHEFNDGIIPLYITSRHFKKKVVFVILEYHNWWLTKYENILSHLSDYPPIDFNGDKRTHCFPEAVVGLKIHDELSIDSELTQGNASIRDFRKLLDRAYSPRIKGIIEEEGRKEKDVVKKPKLVIISRNGSRSISNEGLVVKLAEKIGFGVEVLRPDRTTELAKIYRSLNSSDVMIGVHGAAMTHFMFMNPGCVFIQVIPLGTEWAAETYYGEPATKLGLKYIGYKIVPKESSLYGLYDKDDIVLRDPNSVVKKGWEFTKKIYLDNQTVEIDLKRFRKRLVRAYEYYVSRPSAETRVEVW